MFYIDQLPKSPETRLPRPASGVAGSGGRSRSYFAAAVVACGLAFGAAGFVATASGMDRLGFGQGAQMAVLQLAVAHALDSVGANSAQEAKAHDIVAAKFSKVVSDLDQFQELRNRAIGIIGASSFDRDALEKLRSDTIARLDAESRLAIAGFADIADLLEPEQRAELAAQLERGRTNGVRAPVGPGVGSDKD